MGGASVCQSFLEKNLIEEMDLFIVPTVLGRGIKMFSSSYVDLNYSLVKTNTYGNKMAELKYVLNK